MHLEHELTDQGCVVLEPVCKVDMALESIEKNVPDGVVLDLNLDGQRTTAVARSLNKRGIPFVIVTGQLEKAAEDPALKNAPLVQKPWSRTELLAKLSNALDVAKI